MAMLPHRSPRDPLIASLADYFGPSGLGGRMSHLMRAPDADVLETESEIRVLVELPGMRAEEIDLNLENSVLTISGEKNEERQEENETWHLSERRYGNFARSFLLPREVDQERIEAHFDNGVLTVRIPKTERARRKRIDVRGGDGRTRVETSAGEE